MKNVALKGKSHAGNLHVWLDEGEVASAKPRLPSCVDVVKQGVFCAKRMSVWACTVMLFGLFAPSVGAVTITGVAAQQRLSSNGLVDITVTFGGTASDIAKANCTFTATDSATKTSLPIVHITREGSDSGSGNVWTRNFVWDTLADVGGKRIDDVELVVELDGLGGVQLWEGGPYWAECNVGATKPEEYGLYFWWGDTVGHRQASDSFKPESCPTYGKSNSQLQSSGYIDETYNLLPLHDAATAHLGAPWRMPTASEFSALSANCTTTWTTRNGVRGWRVTGKGSYMSKDIFLPAAGIGTVSSVLNIGSYGYYLSSALNQLSSEYARVLNFSSDYFGVFDGSRYCGQSVRPVRESVAASTASTHLMLNYDGYKIHFDVNDEWFRDGNSASILYANVYPATGTMDDLPYAEGRDVTLPRNKYAREGFEFVGWAKAKNYGAVYQDGATIKANELPTSDSGLVLYAVWKAKTVVITLDYRGWSGASQNIKTKTATTGYGVQMPWFPIVSSSSDVIDGWYTAPSGGTRVDTGVWWVPTKDTTYYLHWRHKTCIIKYNANGGTGSMPNQSFTMGINQRLSLNQFQHDGYVFGGWAKSSDGAVVYTDGEGVLLPTAIDGGTVTLYAVWTPQVVAPSAPTGVSATDGSYADYARVTWSAASGATSYNLYRSTTTSRPSTATKTGVTSPYNDTTATPGTKYYYWIAAVNSAGTTVSSYDTGYRAVSLTLGKSSDSYSSSGGSGSASVTANTSWSASANVSWITFGTKSGSGNGTLTYTVAANTSTSSRTGTITVTAGSGTSYPATKAITVSQGAASDFEIVDGVLTKYKGSGVVVTIPSGVTSIGDRAFYNCSGLTSVTIPPGVTSIGNQAFYNCSGLTSVTIPSSVTSIGYQAFAWCSSLTSVTIPSSVTDIGTEAFLSCRSLTSVTIQSGVTSIGRYAFSDCSSLTSITIPSSVTSIGDSAFQDCSALTSVTIQEGVTSIGGYTFNDCISLTSVTIPSSVTSIGDSAFQGCSGLTSITIPSNVKSIGDDAFFYCVSLTSISVDSANGYYCSINGVLYNKDATELICCPGGAKSVTIPSGVTSIGWHAFYGCSGLTSVTIPSSVTSIGNSAFGGCSGIKTIYVQSGDTSRVRNLMESSGFSVEGVKFVEQVTTYTVVFNANGGTGTMTSQTITYGVSTPLKANTFTKSGYTFAGWSKTAGGSVAYANGASVSNLASAGGSITLYAVWTPQVVAPSAPTGVSATDGSYADYARVTWSAASGATSYNLYRSTTTSRPSTATKMGVTSPYNDTTATPGTKYYYWIMAVNSAGSSVSSYDTGYRAVSLTLDKTTSQYALSGGSGSATVKANTSWSASANVSWITFGTQSANGNGTLTYTVAANTSSSSRSGTITVTAGSGTSYPVAKTIAVSQEEVSDFVIADGVLTKYTGVGGSVTIPLGVTSIGYKAFDGCTGLTSVVIPEGVADIGDNAFYGCYKMTSVTMPSSLKSIGSTAFSYCLGLTSVTIPSGVKSIGYNVFDRCNKLISIDVAAGNAYYSSQDGVLFNKDMSELCIFPPGRSGAYTIPSGVESVGSFAFATCSSLISVSMPSGLKKIGNWAFEGCEWLTSVTMPSSVTNIGSWAFVWCNGLTTVTIPPGVTSIKDNTFSGCSGLATVTIPSSVKEIMSNAFNNCPLKVVHVSHNGEIDTVKQMFTASGFVTSGVTFDIVETTTYKVVFDAQGGVTDWATVEICDGLPVGELPTPRRSGYKFLGWFTTANEGTRVSATTIVTSNVTYYAHWVMETTYYVTFNANGGMGTMDVQPIIYGISTTLDENGYVKSGYTFSGWATMADGEVVYANRASVFNLTTVGEAITLYAVWKIKTCTIIFNANGGTGSMESQILTYGVNAAIKANEFTRNGYAFAGWATTSGGAVKYENCMVVGVDDKTRESVTLYAVWRARTCSVTFNANGGTGVMVRQTFTYGVEVTLNANQFTRGGYTFVGWAMTEEGKSVCADRASVSCLVVADDSITLYAVWEKLVVPAPSVSPADGATFSTDSCLVTLDCAMDGASIYYTTNGATPKTSASYLYTQPFEIRGTVNVKAVAVKDGVKSDYVTATITKVDPVPVETPVITPVNGTTFSTDSCEVTIACPTDGATIYYTTDGTLPTVSESCRYKGAFSITDTATIKAIAVKEGWLESACASATITKVGLTLEGVLGVDSRVRVTTGGEADWVPVNDVNAKEGGTSARSGLGNTDDDSVSWIQLSVNGKGTLSFWCKTSCEHDDDNAYTWDRVEVTVDGQAKPDWYMDGTSQWVQRTIVFDTVAEHTIRIAYVKDESDFNGEDCAWIDEVKWEPETAGGAVIADVTALKEAFGAESSVVRNLTSEEELAKFNDFLGKCGITAANQISEKQKQYAYESFKLSEIMVKPQLFEEEPKLKIDEFKPGKDGWSVSISLTAGDEEIAMAKEALEEHILVGTELTEITAKPTIIARPSEDGTILTFTIVPPSDNKAFMAVRL